MSSTVSIPLALDLGNILIVALGAAIAFIWHTLNTNIATGDQRNADASADRYKRVEDRFTVIEEGSRDRNKRVEDKMISLEALILAIPQRMESFAEQLKRIELMLAQQYPTKDEVQREIAVKYDRLDRLEALLERAIETKPERALAAKARGRA